jgi:hypothetical protein
VCDGDGLRLQRFTQASSHEFGITEIAHRSTLPSANDKCRCLHCRPVRFKRGGRGSDTFTFPSERRKQRVYRPERDGPPSNNPMPSSCEIVVPDSRQVFCAGKMTSIVQKILDTRPARAKAPACRLASAEGWC